MTAADRARRGDVSGSTFDDGRPVWPGRLDKVRNVVRQEMIARQLGWQLRTPPARILDVGAGQGTQSIRLARAGHVVLAVERCRGPRRSAGPVSVAAFQAFAGAPPSGMRATWADAVVNRYLLDGGIGK